MKKILAPFLLLLCLMLISGVIYTGIQISKAPSLDSADVVPDGYLTVVLDKDGNQILSLHDSESNRVYTELASIPDYLEEAFVAIEDTRFYTHKGIDPKGIVRAFFKGVLSGFHFKQGASTITQQLIKNNVLTGWTKENTFLDKVNRKIQEIYLSIRLEQTCDKDWILENYLNTINLGGGTRGVSVAAEYYFGKDVYDLDLAECAMLAGITKNPSGYNPFLHPEACEERRQLVLEAMKKAGYIDEEAYTQAANEDVLSHLDADHEALAGRTFTYFEDALLTEIVNDLQTACKLTKDEAWDLIYSGGLTIHATVDNDLQKICEEILSDSSFYSSDEQASAVLLDVKTGAVLAIAGGRGKDGSLVYNRATESIRQPGSIIKVVGEYAAGLDDGLFTLGTTYTDAPESYSDETPIQNAYRYYKGELTIQDAIACSCNTIALNTFRELGTDRVYEQLLAFGLTTLTDEDKNEALSIGGTYNGVTNLEITAAYNAIAAGGLYTEPYYYTSVYDHDGNLLLEKKASSHQAVSKTTAELLTQAMTEVMASGTGTQADISGIRLAGKSGTTNGNKDLWFTGSSPYFTLGIWGGFDDNREQESSTYVKALWKAVMEKAHDNYLYKDFETEGLTRAYICKKCGNLALSGLCDSTTQGNMTAYVYFKEGNAPTVTCSCHVSLSICKETGMVKNFCSDYETQVFLRSADPDTEDAKYTAPSQERCSVHTFIHQYLPIFEGGGTDTETPDEAGQEDSHSEEEIPNEHHEENSFGSPHENEAEEAEENDFFQNSLPQAFENLEQEFYNWFKP